MWRILPLIFLCACGAQPGLGNPPTGPWTTERGQVHPLTGFIWSKAEQDFVSSAALAAAVGAARFVLIGEKHDNADHHRLQAWLLGKVLGAATRPVAFEMLNEATAEPLAALAQPTPEQVAEAVQWARSGWPPFEMYAPVFAAALEAKAPLVPASPARKTLYNAVLHGLDRWPAERVKRLKLDTPLPAAEQAELKQEIIDTHCGQAPPSMVDGMVLAQQIKDAWMADRLVGAATSAGAVLIAGNGHVRRDRGVPHALARRGVTQAATVALLEVDDARLDVRDYRDLAEYDFVWFTPRVDDLDPCETFKKQLEKMKTKGHGAKRP